MKSKKPKSKPRQSRVPMWLWGGLAIVLVIAVVVFSLLSRAGAPAAAMAAEISVDEAYTRRAAGAFILDVRQPEEWNEYHIPGSTLIPLGELSGRISEVPQDQEIVVVCRSGNRSQEGRNILLQAGFERVSSMAGGVKAWRAAGYPIVSGP